MIEQANVVQLSSRRGSPPIKLTARKIAALQPRSKPWDQWDAGAQGLLVRVHPTGRKVFYLHKRVGQGRGARKRYIKIGDAAEVSLSQARARALQLAVEMSRGIDPKAEKPGSILLSDLIEQYDARLKARGAAKRSEVISSLRRYLAPHIRRPVGDLTRQHVVAAMDNLEAKGKPGAAEYLRKATVALLNWAVNTGALHASPMAGYRRERTTKALRLTQARTGRLTLKTPNRIKTFWQATDAASNPAFRDLLRFLLLTGQRRSETAAMRWSDLRRDGCIYPSSDPVAPDEVYNGAVWVIPAEVTKMGRAQVVPLGSLSLSLLDGCERWGGSDLVFPGRRHRPISGWTQQLAPVREAMVEPALSPHALRRSFRSGLTELKISEAVAEAMIAHQRQGLTGLYDHSTLWAARREAQDRWEGWLVEVLT